MTSNRPLSLILMLCVSVANEANAVELTNKSWPSAGHQEVAIWPHGAPDMKGISQPRESIELTTGQDVVAGRPYTYVENVASPTVNADLKLTHLF